MASGYTEYYVQLINARTKAPINDDTGTYIVMTAGSPALATVYTDDVGTTPAFTHAAGVAQTMTDGVIRFWTASSVASVDLSVVTANGESLFVKALTPSQHRIEVDMERVEQVMIAPYYNFVPTPFVSASVTVTASAAPTGFTIPANSVVKDAFIRVSTLGTAALISVGNAASPSGYLALATGSVTGYKYPVEPELTSATATFQRGALLMASTTGVIRIKALNSAVTALVFQNLTATTLAAAKGWIYLLYDKLPA